jgi:hypothetical protein
MPLAPELVTQRFKLIQTLDGSHPFDCAKPFRVGLDNGAHECGFSNPRCAAN